MPGIPDVLLCDEKGNFHFIELKASGGNAVGLRPHQVAWLSTYSHASVWILVRKVKTEKKPERFLLYPGSAAMDLVMEGLDVEPLFETEGPPDWDQIFNLICPI